MVQLSLSYVPELTVRSQKEDLIAALKTVTDGRLYLEIERARAIKILSDMLEQDGRIAEASEALQELAVETFSSMEKKEKAEFLLEQVRLTLAQRDFSRLGIIANKISKKVLEEEGFEDLRVRYFCACYFAERWDTRTMSPAVILHSPRHPPPLQHLSLLSRTTITTR